jgi:hypothetical protein
MESRKQRESSGALLSSAHPLSPRSVLSAAVLIALLCGLLVNSLVVDTLHWRSFWFLLALCLYQLSEEKSGSI